MIVLFVRRSEPRSVFCGVDPLFPFAFVYFFQVIEPYSSSEFPGLVVSFFLTLPTPIATPGRSFLKVQFEILGCDVG